MRVVVDLQGAQSSANRNRGIGRYSSSLCKALIRNSKGHEIILVLSDLFPDTVQPILSSFEGLLPRENIRIWTAPGPVDYLNPANGWRRGAAELTRETFFASLNPDFVLLTSLFEGLGDDAVTSVRSIGNGPPTAIVLYDLIPLIHRSPYLDNTDVSKWYLEKIEHLRRADLCLAISQSSAKEGRKHLQFPDERCVAISTDADPHFRRIDISKRQEETLRARYGLDRPFLMYTGGIDYRKNVEGLITAYARLAPDVRATHRLAIVCSIQEPDRSRLEALALNSGLTNGELIMTGFVPEDDLLALYNLCSAFVFPSWHEGFGLPVLEAMRCGAPVIGADSSSIPEVIGFEEALFDPHSQEAMTKAIHRVLTDEAFRNRLQEHGATQSEQFSWDRSARTAIAAMEKLREKKRDKRPRLALVSPLPPARSGIADYSSELIRVLSKHYRIDIIADQEYIADPWIQKNCAVHTSEWLVDRAQSYDRVLYHFGNSDFHQHMFPLLEAVPGVVVLHDFFLSGVVANMDVTGYMPNYWSRELYRSHGYSALKHRFFALDTADVVWTYPCSVGVVRDSIGFIVHSPSTLDLAHHWYGEIGEKCTVIPLLRDPEGKADKQTARQKLGIGPEDFLVCTFGMIGPVKQSLRLLEAWCLSSLACDHHCHLVFVGENDTSSYGTKLTDAIRNSGLDNRVHISGWVSADTFRDHLNAADLAVQLRTLSRGETSAAVLDCMKHGLPTIVNANGSMADLDENAVWKLPDDFTEQELIESLERFKSDGGLRQKVGGAAREIILRDHSPAKCAELYFEAIERFYEVDGIGWRALTSAIASLPQPKPHKEEMLRLADAIGQTFPALPRQKQLLIDISSLVQFDAGTGIQRVVRNILKHWLRESGSTFRIEPIYAVESGRYRYARRFTCQFLNCPDNILEDDVVDFGPGDVFFGLDLHPQIVVSNSDFLKRLQRFGVRIVFAVYDLLCVRMPQHFLPGAHDMFSRWLRVVSEGDSAICISKAVAADLNNWISENAPHRFGRMSVASFQLGADLDVPPRCQNISDEEENIFEKLTGAPSFLMVGTIESRKGHRQVLAAFDALWERGVDANLIIVGKPGWLVEETLQQLRSHPLRGQRLFWLENVSDEYLDRIYTSSDCLLAASEGEGFGLPLIEAAQHGLPILARNITIFREVAGDKATYFDGLEPKDLAMAIEEWLETFEQGMHPKSQGMSWMSWRESADQLLAAVLRDELGACPPD